MSSALKSSEPPAPQRLSDLVGQARATAVLRNAIRREQVAHAYLFRGLEGVGKSTAARLFAQALNCLGEQRGVTGDACGRCRSCQLIAQGNHPDVRLITLGVDRQGRRRTEISIDQIRQNPHEPRETPRPLVQDAILRPALGRHKVYLIDPAERMNPAASNALLKMLEDPPPHVVLVLVSSQPAALLPTVLSRCQQVTFQAAGSASVTDHLRSLGLEAGTAASLAALSGGRVGWAVTASRRPEVLEVRRCLLDLCAALPAMTLPQSLRLAERIKEQALRLAAARTDREAESAEEETDAPISGGERGGGDRELRAVLPWCLDVMALWFRDHVAASQGGVLVNPDYAEAIQASLTSRPRHGQETVVAAILGARQQIQRNANIDLALEALAVRLLSGDDEAGSVQPGGSPS
jgi:DNA polymerase-3 subunit delta'